MSHCEIFLFVIALAVVVWCDCGKIKQWNFHTSLFLCSSCSLSFEIFLLKLCSTKMLLLSKNFARSLLILIFLCCEWEHLYMFVRETRREAMRAKHAELWIKKERVVEFVNLNNKKNNKKKKKRKEINQKQESVYWLFNLRNFSTVFLALVFFALMYIYYGRGEAHVCSYACFHFFFAAYKRYWLRMKEKNAECAVKENV